MLNAINILFEVTSKLILSPLSFFQLICKFPSLSTETIVISVGLFGIVPTWNDSVMLFEFLTLL